MSQYSVNSKFSGNEVIEESKVETVSLLSYIIFLLIKLVQDFKIENLVAKEGKTRTLFRSSNQYEGEYHLGLRHGHGVFQFNNGSRYEGEYRERLKHGSGKFLYCDGSSYHGNWKHDKKHGFGKYIYQNGDIYEGNWKVDNKHGTGAYKYKEAGILIRSTWIDGVLKGPIEIFYLNFRYHGSWSNDGPVGEGVFSFGMKFMLPGHIQMFFELSDGVTKSSHKAMKLYAKRDTSKSLDKTVENADKLLVCVPRFIAHEITRYDYSKLPLQPIPLPQEDSSTTICTQSSASYTASVDNDYALPGTPTYHCNYPTF